MCLSGAGAAIASHQCHWHQLIKKSKLVRWWRRAPAEAWGGQEMALSVLHSWRQRDSSLFGPLWKASLSSASDVLRLKAKSVTEGAFAQCCALCQRATERLCCVVTWKNSRESKPLTSHLQSGVERSPSQGSSAFPAVDTNWHAKNNIYVEQKLYCCIFNQSNSLKTKHNKAEITIGSRGCDVFHLKYNLLG